MAVPESALVPANHGHSQAARWDPFLAMDRLDDDAIVAELQGQTVKALVYEFAQNGQQVSGLSKAGVDAVVREMAKQGEVLREIELNVLETPEEFVAHVKAGRFLIQTNQQTGETKETLLDTVFGVKRQPKKYPNGASNPFAYEQAVSKAARNAKMRLLREDLKQAVIQMAKQQGKYRRVEPDSDTGMGPAARPKARVSSMPENKPRPKQASAEGFNWTAFWKVAKQDLNLIESDVFLLVGNDSFKGMSQEWMAAFLELLETVRDYNVPYEEIAEKVDNSGVYFKDYSAGDLRQYAESLRAKYGDQGN